MVDKTVVVTAHTPIRGFLRKQDNFSSSSIDSVRGFSITTLKLFEIVCATKVRT